MRVCLIILKFLGKTGLKLLSLIVFIIFIGLAVVGGIASSILQRLSALAILVLIIIFIAGELIQTAGPLTLLLFVPPVIGVMSTEIIIYLSKGLAKIQVFLSQKSSYKNLLN